MTFPERVEYKKAITIYKSLQCDIQYPDYLKNKFSYVTDTRLRSSNKQLLHIPKPNKEFYRKSLNYSGPKLWNDIPYEIRTSTTLNQFRDNYLHWKFPCWMNQ